MECCWLLILTLIVASSAPFTGVRGVSAFKLTLLHTNDVHARIEQTNKYSAVCSDEDAKKGACFGGMARIKSKVDEIRQENPGHVLLLSAGDQSTGTLWFTTFGPTIMPTFMNIIGYDAMALGNHEFDNGVNFLRQFVKNTTFDVLSCNLDLSKNKDLESLIAASTVKTVGGEKIGIVGYTTVETATISRPDTIGFKPEIESVRKAVNQLKGQGIKKIIAVGHAGYGVDKSIGESVSDIDIIVGGHTNTFLYTGTPPSNEEPVGPYPTVVKNPDGKHVQVVQDYAYGKYLGHLEVEFDNNGDVTSATGNPILLDNSVPQDPSVLEFMKPKQKELEIQRLEFVGITDVFLEGSRFVCRKEECNMGNMLTDAMVHDNRRRAVSSGLENVGIALVNGGGIRSPVDKGNITMEDILSVQPFRNTVDVVELSGDTIHKALEYCASRLLESDDGLFGGFLQVSGLRIVYDLRKPSNERVADVQALCAECRVPEYKPLNKTHVYRALMSTFLAQGGDGYAMFGDNIKSYKNGDLDTTIMKNYVSQLSPVAPALEGRIRIIDDENENRLCTRSTGHVMTSSILVFSSTLLLLATGRLLL